MEKPFGSAAPIDDALGALGRLLDARGISYAFVVAGGAALALLDRLARTTADVDVLCIRNERTELVPAPNPLPRDLLRWVEEVATDFGLPSDWLNSEMSSGYSAGLPIGYGDRIQWRRYGSLEIGVLHRTDLIALKLEAAADHVQRGETWSIVPTERRHLDDLVALRATTEELNSAATWVRSANVARDLDDRIDWVIRHVAEQHRR
ncbi:MAG: hypothetical protein HYR75_06295 [Gemmatimonadetes bacterium]|nr:hypothetical protein [Gemmatimonadota bacterium]MBI3569424.1 hypothetical protein [Gemmatimonadota bacterium]